MENNLEDKDSTALSERRLVLIGARWAGKSYSGNTILGKERFECGRTRTAQCDVRHEDVQGRKLIVVDVPGWSNSLSLAEIPERDKQRFKLSASKCPPGPNVFLLVIPIDCAFPVEQKRTVEEHMKLLGERVWRYTMVLFTCGDFLGEKTIEQHIESEGDSLKWLIERCGNRYHVFNNKKKGNSSQVTQLLEKIDDMVWHNNGTHYEVDEQTLSIIKEKQEKVAERANERRMKAEEERQQRKTLIPEEMKTIPKVQMVLLGSRGVGKTSVANAILRIKEPEDGKRTAQSVVLKGFVGKIEITLVDTPGWWKAFSASDTPEVIKEEVMYSMFLCPPGPHVFLLVVDADTSFNAKHLNAVTTHVELLGEGVWSHTIVVFTRGDWLGTNTIEQYIEGEGKAMQCLIEQCGNRYHIIDNKNPGNSTQIAELLEKITETVAANGFNHFVPDKKIHLSIDEKRLRVEHGAILRQTQVKAKRRSIRASKNILHELRIVLLGMKTSGKSATGNTLLRKRVFASCQNDYCQVEEEKVADRLITVIDTPGWYKSSKCTKEIDKEIVRGLSMSPLGVHAILLVVPSDLKFGESQQVALEEHMNLFDASIWKHAMVLFTYGDKLADKSIEEHIEREYRALRWLVDKCENKYHVVNNMKKSDMSQVTELFEKIEEMVAGNSGQLYCPDMNVDHRIEEKFRRRQLKNVLKQQLEEEYRRRELELMISFKKTLLKMQADNKESVTRTKPKSLIKTIGQRKKENTDTKISQEIEKLDKEIMKATQLLRNSKEILMPDLKGESQRSSIAESSQEGRMSTSQFDNVLQWLSTLHISKNGDNQMTLNFSQTSGYRSVLCDDFYAEDNIPE